MIQITRNLRTLINYVGFILRDEQENIRTDDNFNKYSLKVCGSAFFPQPGLHLSLFKGIVNLRLEQHYNAYFEPHIYM